MAVVEKTDEVTPEDLVRRARAMAPMVRERAEAAEQNRVLAPEVIAELKQNDLFCIFVPKRPSKTVSSHPKSSPR